MQTLNLTQKLIIDHLSSGCLLPEEPIELRVDQTSCDPECINKVTQELQKSTFTLNQTGLNIYYSGEEKEDKNNLDETIFMNTFCENAGIHLSPIKQGLSSCVHLEQFAHPGKLLLSTDSRVCALGCLGMLSLQASCSQVAQSIKEQTYKTLMPPILGIYLEGTLSHGVSVVDLALELLSRSIHLKPQGKIIEYYGPALKQLSVQERYTLAALNAQLGVLSCVFPSDEQTRRYLLTQQRLPHYKPLERDLMSKYDQHDEVNLSELVPMIQDPANPHSACPVTSLQDELFNQATLGSILDPSCSSIALGSMLLKKHRIHSSVKLSLSFGSKKVLKEAGTKGYLNAYIRNEANLNQMNYSDLLGLTLQNKKHCICSPQTILVSCIYGRLTNPQPFLEKNQKRNLFKTLFQRKALSK